MGIARETRACSRESVCSLAFDSLCQLHARRNVLDQTSSLANSPDTSIDIPRFIDLSASDARHQMSHLVKLGIQLGVFDFGYFERDFVLREVSVEKKKTKGLS
jgi:hypothetical protein